MLEGGRRPCRVGGRTRGGAEGREGKSQIPASPSGWALLGARKEWRPSKKPESKWKQGAFVPVPVWGSHRPAGPFPHSSRAQSATSGLRPLWSPKGCRRRGLGAWKFPQTGVGKPHSRGWGPETASTSGDPRVPGQEWEWTLDVGTKRASSQELRP